MKVHDPDARRYLIGALPAAEQERFEEALLADEARHAAVAAEADDLVDDYAAGRLSIEERRAVEDRLLATDDGLRVRAARALARAAPAATPRRWWLVAAPLVAAAAALTIWWTRPGEPVQREVAVALAAVTRDATQPELELAPDVATVRISFELDAETRAAAKRVTFTSGERKVTRAFVDPLVLPARELARAEWEVVGGWAIVVEDSAGAPLAMYSLRVR